MMIYLGDDREGAEPVGSREDRIAGCLLGGAVGDALGCSVKYLSPLGFRRISGRHAVREPIRKGGQVLVGEATQLTVFTADAVLRAIVCDENKTNRRPFELFHEAYLRWIHTQGLKLPEGGFCPRMNGWLAKRPALHRLRADDEVAVAALGSGQIGSVSTPINDSRGYSAVVRVAPVGLVESITECFCLGADAAAITHGHPCSYLSAGTFAAMVHAVMEGAALEDAVARSLDALQTHTGSEEVSSAVQRAMRMAHATAPAAEVVEFLGKGYQAHEALAIAVYASLANEGDLVAAVRFAANHSGNSVATAAMTGNLMGAKLGKSAIPDSWLERLELREELEVLARDLSVEFLDTDEWLNRYPGW